MSCHEQQLRQYAEKGGEREKKLIYTHMILQLDKIYDWAMVVMDNLFLCAYPVHIDHSGFLDKSPFIFYSRFRSMKHMGKYIMY